jgi:glyoxylase-like metal-dependent hydrolase (beta-lactamase superfamily II)
MRWTDHVRRLVVGPLETNCYVLLPKNGRDAAVIDPGGDSDRILDTLKSQELSLKLAVLTHGHIDHTYGLGELLGPGDPEVPVVMHDDDRPLLERIDQQAGFMGFPAPSIPTEFDQISDGAVIRIGGRELEALHTPGHSPGSMSFLLREEKILFSGDTLFCGGVGRTDLWGGSWEQLRRSIETRLLTLDPETAVLPGHGEPTTIGSEALWLRETALYNDARGGFE